MKKKILLIGPRGSGKSSLANALEDTARPLRCTQDVIYRGRTIDVPASYLENHWMYRHIIAIAQNQAALICMLVPQEIGEPFYSPQFAQVFTCPVVGVVTHVPRGEAPSPAAVAELRQAGINEPYLTVDANDPVSLEAFNHSITAVLGGDADALHH